MQAKDVLARNGWVVECECPFEIRKTVDGETVGFATGEAADVVLESLGTPVQVSAQDEQRTPTGVQTGSVKKWLGEKGFGFIMPDDGGEDVFVHQSVIDMDGFRQLEEGQRVEFTEGVGRTGKVAAEKVRLV